MPHAAVSNRQRQRAKSLRQAMTCAETLLWRYLKARHIDGLGFRRQVPMRGYVADFVCHAAKLIVELDGETHDFQSRQHQDNVRDAWFGSQGYVVLRFNNDDVMKNLTGAVGAIHEAASSRVHGAPPSLSLPHKGGGNDQIISRRVASAAAAPSPTLPRKRRSQFHRATGKAAS